MSIILRDIGKSFEGKTVFSHISLELPEKGRVCLFGPSGCGKTTLLRIIMGLEKPDEGEVTGVEKAKFACQFQENRLLPWYTVRQNLRLTIPETEDPDIWLQRARMADAGDLYPDELSGGMRRRVSLIRALASPGILVLDEPLRELDSDTVDGMIRLIDRYAEGRLLLLVTHDREQAVKLRCDFLEIGKENTETAGHAE